jgi:hypothetical protein
VGGVSERPARDLRGSASAAVEGTPICRMATPFAGIVRNAGLGRSVRLRWVSSPADARTDDSGCPLVPEEGNDVNLAFLRRHASFTRTKDPSTFLLLR